jgi:4-hydroxy-tetrahydrodipicolinate synthase
MTQRLTGVIAAAPTPVQSNLTPDLAAFALVCQWLMEQGCDGLNICGTTGEATSFSREQRSAVMATAANAIAPGRMMAGTGAAAIDDAVALTRHAAALGLAGALLLPPFYYKDIDDDGVVRYFERIVTVTEAEPIALYLYNFPALSGIRYTPALVRRLRSEFGARIRGIKDSSGDLDYAATVAAISPDLDVFPSSESTLKSARTGGPFAGCISATANVNAGLCRRALHAADDEALEQATRVRQRVAGRYLIAGVKAILADLLQHPGIARIMPPLTEMPDADRVALIRDYRSAMGLMAAT